MSADQALHQTDYQHLAEFRYHLRGFLKFSERAAAQMGLSAQQHQALLAIKGTPGRRVTISILAERLGIRHNSAVELIDRLIANGLAQRRQNPDDRREVLIDLTNRAERMCGAAAIRPGHNQNLRPERMNHTITTSTAIKAPSVA
jgi:DNA-binding MarR family transcriptional regulator